MTCCAPDQTLPASITAGLSFQATLAVPDYPAPAWQATAYLRGPAVINLVGADQDGAHHFTANASATKDYKPGRYWYVIRVTDGADTVQIETGVVEILPDLSTVTGTYDGRTQAQIALDAIDAVLGRRATIDQERYRINNRELYRTPISDLLKLRSYYAVQVKRERGCNNGRWGRQIAVRFTQ